MATYVSDLASLQAAVASPPSDTLIYLTNDITLSETTYLNITNTVTLDGQGFSLIVPQDADYGPYSAGFQTTYNFAIYIGNGSLTLQNITLDGNQNVNSVGGVFGYNGPLTINDGTLITNFVRTVYQGTEQDVVSMRKNLTMNGGSVSNNEALGISVSNNALFTLNNGLISYNNFTPVTSGVSYSNTAGAGVRISAATFIMNDGLITHNTVATTNYKGGGLFLNGTGTINGGTISYNSAYTGGGIYIFSNYGLLTLNGGTISYNSATAGGGIYSESRASDLICGQITNNQASSSGGGIYIREPGLRIGIPDNCPCQDCPLTFPLLCDFPQICDCPTCQPLPSYCLCIDNNTAPTGGGVCAAYGVEINCALITQNSATNGGGIYGSSLEQTLTINNTAILCNHSTAGGAGIYLSYMETVLQSCLLAGNTASTNGGAIFIGGASDETILTTSPDTCFTNNLASVPLFSAQATPTIQYCCKSIEPVILNNYDIYSSIKNAGQKISTPNPVSSNQTLSWNILFTHTGTLSTLTLKDPLTPFTYIANTATATINGTTYPVTVTGTPDNPTFTISEPATAGQLIALTFDVSVPQVLQDTTYTNTITLNNNTTATGTITVLGTSVLSPTDTLIKTAYPSVAQVGDIITYEVTLIKS